MLRGMDPEPYAFVKRIGNLIKMIGCWFEANHWWTVEENHYHDSSSDLDYSCKRCKRFITTDHWRVARARRVGGTG